MLSDDEREAIGLPPAPAGLFNPDPEATTVRWFWRASTVLLLIGVVVLWVRLGEADETIQELDAGVDTLMEEVRLNRAFICRTLHAQGELKPGGPCFSDEIYPLWEEYAVAMANAG